MSEIKKLSETTINRIAAGEVVERPASVIKELVENSIDAGATRINITIEAAGKNLIIVSDNGKGMTQEELELAIQRHTTSKLDEENIMNIITFGFRGEALPSISSISKMLITSKKAENDYATQLVIEGGELVEIKPVRAQDGTKIEIRDLFYATPARLKFLKNDRTEQSACLDVIKKIALVYPAISFQFTADGKELLKTDNHPDLPTRIKAILDKNFIENSAKISFTKENFKITGYVSIPTYNRSTSADQYLYVNNRPIRDKLISTATRVAYQDYLARDRHPVVIIFIETLPQLVDVNVHPAKAEVRFRDSNDVRSMLISAIKDGLSSTSQQTSSLLANNFINYAKNSNFSSAPTLANNISNMKAQDEMRSYGFPSGSTPSSEQDSLSHKTFYKAPSVIPERLIKIEPNVKVSNENYDIELNTKHPLGAACAQLHSTYIISQAEDSIIIVDQHAAHERLVYEKIKRMLETMNIPTQRLIMPAIVELPDPERASLIENYNEHLAKFGLTVKRFGQTSIVVHEAPSLLGDFDVHKLIQDLADNLRDIGEHVALQELIEHVTETYACHNSIRAGRKMSINEMNELLREMENTPFSGQCNHGRPTYVKLKLADIEKLFGRR